MSLDLDALAQIASSKTLDYDLMRFGETRRVVAAALPALVEMAQERGQLLAENAELAADQCHAGYGDDYGNHRCRYQDKLAVAEKALEQLAIERALLAGKEPELRAEAWRGHCQTMTKIARDALAAIRNLT